MYYSAKYYIKGYCEPLHLTQTLKTDSTTITENLNDIVSYLYEKHYGIPYNELSWYLEPGAKEFVSKIENDWLHNTLDTWSIYQDKEFVKKLLLREYEPAVDDLDDLKSEFETHIEDEFKNLDKQTMDDLYEACGDMISYVIYSEGELGTQYLDSGFVLFPESDE